MYNYLNNWIAWATITITTLTTAWPHRGNIARLREGAKRSVGDKRDAWGRVNRIGRA